MGEGSYAQASPYTAKLQGFCTMAKGYKGLPQGFEATRYHSLVIEPESVPKCLSVTSWTEEGVIMGVRHEERPVEGIQFHPESILTRSDRNLLKNLLLEL
jgi:anthranilate synthase component II